MTQPGSAGELTSQTAGSRNRAVQFVRTRLGPLVIILLTPPAAIIFWIVCTFEPFNGSLAPLLSAAGWQSVAAHWPWPSTQAAEIILVFVAVEVILLLGLPGKVFEGPITPSGNRPRYKLNGVPAWFITLALFLGCSFGLHLFNAGIVWDHFGEILATLVLFALVFCLFLYFKGRYGPSSEDHSLSGNFIWDYYWGVELHPRLFGVRPEATDQLPLQHDGLGRDRVLLCGQTGRAGSGRARQQRDAGIGGNHADLPAAVLPVGKRLLHLAGCDARPVRLLHLLGGDGLGAGGVYADRAVPGAAPERAGLAAGGRHLRAGGGSGDCQLRGGCTAPAGAGHERRHAACGDARPS